MKNYFFEKPVSRRSFLKLMLTGFAAFAFTNTFGRIAYAKAAPTKGRKKRAVKAKHDLVAVGGDDPYQMTVQAVKEMGGMEMFVKPGHVVVIKPNIGWDRTPEQAANTNPFVVAALVELCFKAGAKKVNVFDNTCNSAERCYVQSGIQKAAEEKGARVYHLNDWNMVKAEFDHASPMAGWPVFRDAIDCDTFIIVPILKHHGLTRLTLSMKNLMGVCSGVRGMIHQDIGKKLVDMTGFINPDLTVIDGFRMLTRHGPQGGNLEDVTDLKKIIVSTDPTLADLYACRLAEVDPQSVPYLKEAMERGFGITDMNTAGIHEI